jgi:hypothetical protein
MLNLIIPACGKSTRFPNLRPKWLLTHPSGKSMLEESIRGLNLENVDRIVAVVLKEQEEKYGFLEAITESVGDDRFEFLLLDKQTSNQPETLSEAIRLGNIEGCVVSKDSDNYLESDIKYGNFVGAIDLRKIGHINAGNKSYITSSIDGHVANIVEKDVISNMFCCGLYGFEDSQEYLKYYDTIKDSGDIYVSHVIHAMLLDGAGFQIEESKDFIDWGTLDDWNKFRNEYKTIFCDIDGVVVKSACNYMKPYLGPATSLRENVDVLNKLQASGKTMLIMTTARAEKFRDVTVEQLKREGLNYDALIMGLLHAKRIVVNDFAASNPYPSCEAINIKRNTNDLEELL